MTVAPSPAKATSFSGIVKFSDVIDFADDGRTCDTANSGNGSNEKFQLPFFLFSNTRKSVQSRF